MTFDEEVKRQLTIEGATAAGFSSAGREILDTLTTMIPNHSTTRPDADRAYPNREPGTLKRSYTSNVVADPDSQLGWKVVLTSPDQAATPLELGTLGRGVIRAKGRGKMRFFQENGQRWRRTSKVFHPGNKAYHYLSNATRRVFGRPDL